MLFLPIYAKRVYKKYTVYISKIYIFTEHRCNAAFDIVCPPKQSFLPDIVTGWPLHEAIKAAGYNQLRSLGILGRGEIAAGQIADLILVDDSLAPRMTTVGGEVMRS